MKINFYLFFIGFLLLLVSCRPGMSVSRDYAVQKGDKELELFTLTNKKGMSIQVTNYAASLTSVCAPDKKGILEPVVLGFDSVDSYLGKHPKFGATIGRFANRIKNAQFVLGDKIYHLEKNNKQHSIHGGAMGFNRQFFTTQSFNVLKDTAMVVFKYRSNHLEGGFPGVLDLYVTYKLTNQNEVILEYRATTDRPTVLNLTNHSYFNLTGCKESVLNHTYLIKADSITALDSLDIPTGELKSVTGSEYDFNSPQSLEKRMQGLKKGYDVNYKLNKPSDSLGLVAVVTEPVSGRVLKAYTTEPGLQFYVPKSNMDYLTGHHGNRYGKCYGFCLEMQHFPDSPNHSHFPSTVLLPGEVYRQTTIYKFEVLQE